MIIGYHKPHKLLKTLAKNQYDIDLSKGSGIYDIGHYSVRHGNMRIVNASEQEGKEYAPVRMLGPFGTEQDAVLFSRKLLTEMKKDSMKAKDGYELMRGFRQIHPELFRKMMEEMKMTMAEHDFIWFYNKWSEYMEKDEQKAIMLGRSNMKTIGQIFLNLGVEPETVRKAEEQFEEVLPESIIYDYGIGRK